MRPSSIPRVLFIQQDSHIGGAEISQLNLLKAIDKTRYKPIVVIPSSTWQRFAISGVDTWIQPVLYLKRTSSPSLLLKYFTHFVFTVWALLRRLKRFPGEIRIIHTGSMGAQLHAAFLGKLTGIPVVWHMRDSVREDFLGKLIVRTCSWGAEKIITNSYAVLEELGKAGISLEKCQVIHNAVDLELLDPGIKGVTSFRKDLGIDDDTLLVLHIGKVMPAKGQDLLVRAIPLVLSRVSNVHFTIIGGTVPGFENYIKELEGLSFSLGIRDKLTILEFQSEIIPIMAAADIVVNTSRMREPFGRALIEAMALKIPVIGPNHGGVPEVIDDKKTGLLFTPNNYRELARCLNHLLLNDKMRQDMGRAGRLKVERFFNLRSHVEQVQLVYDSLLEK